MCRCQFLGKSAGGSPLGCEALVKDPHSSDRRDLALKICLEIRNVNSETQTGVCRAHDTRIVCIDNESSIISDVHSRPVRVSWLVYA